MKNYLNQSDLLKKIFWALLILVLLVLLNTNYRYYFGDMNDSLHLRLNLISLFLVVVFGVILKLKKETMTNILLALGSLVVSLYLVEIFLHFLNFNIIPTAQKAERISSYDYRTNFEVIEDLQNESISAVPRIAPMTFFKSNGVIGKGQFFPIIPLSGIANKTTVFCNESGRYTIYDSDKHGFNNKNQVWDADGEKWILIGDSFAHGACVNSEDNIAGVIAKNTNNTIINLAYSGNGPLAELATLVEYASILKPKKVFWIYCEGNDLTDLHNEVKNTTLMQYLYGGFSQKLFGQQENIDTALQSYIDLNMLRKSKLVNKNKDKFQFSGIDYTKRIFRLYNIRDRLGLANYALGIPPALPKILDKANKIVTSWGGELYFVYLPTYLRYASYVPNHDEYKRKKEVLEMANKLNIKTIDIHDKVFSKHKDPTSLFPYKRNGHYTPEGYALTSKAVMDTLNL
jgi:hypothetical protein